jgi:hypothetical protein
MFQRFFLFFVFCRRSNQTLLSCYSIFINNNFCIILCCLFLDSLHSFLRIFTHKKIEKEEAWQAAAQVIMMNASILKNTMMVIGESFDRMVEGIRERTSHENERTSFLTSKILEDFVCSNIMASSKRRECLRDKNGYQSINLHGFSKPNKKRSGDAYVDGQEKRY